MQRSFVLLFAGALLLSACSAVPSSDDGAGQSSSSSSASSISSVPTGTGSSTSSTEARIIEIQASNWTFTPSVITAKVGEKVQLKVTNVSGVHGILVKDLGIDLKLAEGETGTVDLPTDKAGTFSFRCNIMCGEGHKDMTGTITISE